MAVALIDDSDGPQTIAQFDAVYRTAFGIRPLRRGDDAGTFCGLSLGRYPDGTDRGFVEIVNQGEVSMDADPNEVFAPGAFVFIVEGNPQAVTAKPNGLPIGRVAWNQIGVSTGQVAIQLWVTVDDRLNTRKSPQ